MHTNTFFSYWHICLTLFYGFVSLAISACANLDANLFNPDDSIPEYRLDNYAGEVDFRLDSTYTIKPSLIHLFKLKSRTPDEVQGVTIQALYIGDTARIAQDTVILYNHGNRDHMDFYWQRAKLLANAGGKNRFGVMMIDYRGYGLSEGEPTEQGMYADVNAALQWLKDKGLAGNRLIMYGFSLGSAPATHWAAYDGALKPAKLILEAPFASTSVMVQDAALLDMPASFFTTNKVSNADKIKLVPQPFLWLHGTADDFLNIRTHGEVVYKNYQGIKGVAERVIGANHGDLPKVMGYDKYKDRIASFISQ